MKCCVLLLCLAEIYNLFRSLYHYKDNIYKTIVGTNLKCFVKNLQYMQLLAFLTRE